MIEPLVKSRIAVDGAAPMLSTYGDVLEELRFSGGWQAQKIACGLLVGRHYRDGERGALYVECEGFVAGTHVTDVADFTRDLRMQWKAAQSLVRSQFGDAELVGWYVSGKGLGPPSGDTMILHNTFFNHDWQTGLWLDLDGETLAVRTTGDALQTGAIGTL